MSQGLNSKFTKHGVMPLPAASETALEPEHCESCARAGAILMIVLAMLTYGGIAYLAGWLP